MAGEKGLVTACEKEVVEEEEEEERQVLVTAWEREKEGYEGL